MTTMDHGGTERWTRFDWMLDQADLRSPIPDGYTIRSAVSADIGQMMEVIVAAYRSDPVWSGLEADIERRVGGRIRRLLGPTGGIDGAHFIVAVRAKNIVGLNGVAVRHESEQNMITGICVHPKHQGRGLGTALLGCSLAWLRDQGVKRVTVTTDIRSAAAAVYGRFGAIRKDGASFENPPRRNRSPDS
jgi:GNAT superfamily N-acetyltransferase